MSLGNGFWIASTTIAAFATLYVTTAGVGQFQTTSNEEKSEPKNFLHKPPSRNRNFGDWLRDLGYEIKTDFSSNISELQKSDDQNTWLKAKIKLWMGRDVNSSFDSDALSAGCMAISKALLTNDKDQGLEQLKKFCFKQTNNAKST